MATTNRSLFSPRSDISIAVPTTLAVTFAMLLAVGCGSDPGDIEDPIDPPLARATWHQDVAPIIAEHCVGCHSAGGIAPFSLESYEDVAPIADFLINTVELGIMPPWSAADSEDCAPRHQWREDPRPSAAKMDTLRAWLADGTPLGDAATAAPLPPRPNLNLDGVTHTLAPQVGYPTSGINDEFICYVMDPQLDRLSWLTGLEVVPGDIEVVHHVVILAAPPDTRAAIEAQAGPDGLYNCFGGAGLDGLYTLGVWVPGAMPFETPENVGTPIAAGSAVVMQIHYHPAGKQHAPDITRTKLRITETPQDRTFLFTALGNAAAAPFLRPGPNDRGQVEFRVPANIRDHVESMSFPLNIQSEERFPIVAVFPHMHYVGTKLETRITRATPLPGEPDEECLINIPRWDFDWQRTYFYDADMDQVPTIGDGDVIDIRCEYDNTLANPFAQRALLELGLTEPIDVFLGEESLDEMCLAGFGIIF